MKGGEAPSARYLAILSRRQRLAKAKAERERERALLEAELERRLSLPLDQWELVGEASDVTSGARAHLAAVTRKR